MSPEDSPSPKNPFARKLDDMLSKRGEAAKLAEATGVPSSHISKMCAGVVLPSPTMLEQLTEPMRTEDRAALVTEYLLLHRPKNAANVRIFVSEHDAQQDRLERAIQYLDPVTRDSLAALVEAVRRAPAAGSAALRHLRDLFDITSAPPDTPKAQFINTSEESASHQGNPDVKAEACSDPIPAQPAISADTAPGSPSTPPWTATSVRSATAPTGTSDSSSSDTILKLPRKHWHSPHLGEDANSRAAEATQNPPTPEPREDVIYPKAKGTRKR